MRQFFNALTIFLGLIITSLQSTAQTWDWAIKTGGKASNISADNFGNIYKAGIFLTDTLILGSDTLLQTGTGGNDLLLIKVDSLGNIKWARSAGGTGSESATAITTDSQGNIYITGMFMSPSITFGSNTLIHTAGGWQMYVVKYDSTGNAIWAKTHSGNASSTSWGIKADHSDNIVVTGEFNYSPITFGSVTLNTYGMFVLKFDKNGTAIWGKDQGQMGTSVGIDSLNNIFVSGYFNGNKTIGPFNLINNSVSGYSDVYIVKYDSSGNILWAKSAGSTGIDMAYSVAIDNSGNAYMTGTYGQMKNTSITFGSTTLSNQGDNDIFLVKYDSSGNVLWAKNGSGVYEDKGNSVAIDNLGNIYLTGFFDSPTINFSSQILTNSSSTGTREIYIVKYDTQGNVTGTIRIGGTGSDSGVNFIADGQNNLYFSGGFGSSSINLPPFTLTNSDTTQSKICLAKLNSFLSGVPNIDNNISTIIFPNPLSTQTTLQTDRFLKNASLTVCNSVGQTVKHVDNLSGQTVLFHRDNLPSGLYFVRLTQDGETLTTGKLMIVEK